MKPVFIIFTKGGEKLEQREFELLLSACKNAIERFVRYRIPSKADADDILQEVYLSAWLKNRKKPFAYCKMSFQNKLSVHAERERRFHNEKTAKNNPLIHNKKNIAPTDTFCEGVF